MKRKIIMISLLLTGALLTAPSLFKTAQARSHADSSAMQSPQPRIFQGIVMDLRNDDPMQYARITNLQSGVYTETGRDGRFQLMAKKNDLLQIEQLGYRTDTLVVTEFELKRIYLTAAEGSILLEEVRIEALTNQQLEAELERTKQEGQITESSKERGGVRISPSRLFGEQAKQARRRHERLLAEQDRRLIDRRFSVETIQKFTPLKGEALDRFMLQYRPDVEFVKNASEQAFTLYILDSYAEFNKNRKPD